MYHCQPEKELAHLLIVVGTHHKMTVIRLRHHRQNRRRRQLPCLDNYPLEGRVVLGLFKKHANRATARLSTWNTSPAGQVRLVLGMTELDQNANEKTMRPDVFLP